MTTKKLDDNSIIINYYFNLFNYYYNSITNYSINFNLCDESPSPMVCNYQYHMYCCIQLQ